MKSTNLTEQALQKQDWPLIELGNLTVTRSPALSEVDALTHAFTTRLGGNSAEPLNWFNLGRHWPSEESRQDAMHNRRVLCQLLGLDVERLTVPGQQHTTNIHVVDPATARHEQRLPDLDGAVTDAAGLPILLHFADCVPVIIYDAQQKVLAIVHAGWKGTAGGIARKAVELMIQRWNTRPRNIVAAVGPAIGSCCYPTGADVAAKLGRSVENADGLIVPGEDNQPRPDLKAINAMQLLESGVGWVDVSAFCTACHPEIFYSHRQSGGKTGRQGAIGCIQ